MFTEYTQALDFLYTNLPMYQRVGAIAYRKDLVNTIKLCEVLGNPHMRFKSIHIAGTNGKGSTSHMLASILQSSGYKTGLYTSPHLKEFTERIKINGKEINKGFVISFVNRIKDFAETIQPSFFEITVAMAFEYFAQQEVDVAVIEVGLGGRLDSTNIITPIVSVITNISYDHKDILGDTLEKIATEKAGIIKAGVPVVIIERQPEVENIFSITALSARSKISYASDGYTVYEGDRGLDIFLGKDILISGLSIPLKGNYQFKNIAGVLATVDVLRDAGFQISKGNIVYGLEATVTQTGLKGRWQKLGVDPLMICDTGHNAAGVSEVIHQIRQQKFSKLFIIWGMVKDKEPSEILALLPTEAYYFFCEAHIPRALNAHELKEKAAAFNLFGEVVCDVNRAIEKASRIAKAEDFIFIGGSTFIVAEIVTL